jgi:serine/threonine-protein kinase
LEDVPYFGAIVAPILFLVGLMAAVVAVRPAFAARGVLRAGLGAHDVADAAASSATARDANVEHTLAQVRLLRTPWARGAFALASASSLWYLVVSAWTDQGLGRLLQTLIGIGWGASCLGLAVKPELVAGALAGGSPEVANLLRRLWAGPVGRWFFRIAGIGLTRGKALPVPESAPTEVLLGRAAEELFGQLPKDQRARLGDVQEVIHSLERAAAALRVRRDALGKGLAEAGAPGDHPRRARLIEELEAARTAVEQRLATAVAALENLRLDLLRLRAGVGSPDDLTGSIEEARSVGEAVDVELAARREVESATRG